MIYGPRGIQKVSSSLWFSKKSLEIKIIFTILIYKLGVPLSQVQINFFQNFLHIRDLRIEGFHKIYTYLLVFKKNYLIFFNLFPL
jgi:hypothetical protein